VDARRRRHGHEAKQRFNLDTGGKRYRYYLVWITALPPGADLVEIGEIGLAARSGAN
jgi:hypothetical protein